MRIFKAGHVLFVLLIVTFGLFVANTLWLRGPAPDPDSDFTVTVFTDLPSRPDVPAPGFGGFLLGLAILCALFAFISAFISAALALTGRCHRMNEPPALLN